MRQVAEGFKPAIALAKPDVPVIVVNATVPLSTSRESMPPRLEPLFDVIARDLKKKRVEDELTKQVEGMSAAERTQRLLELGFDVRDE